MKKTKQIIIKNVCNENIVIKSIDYSVAIKLLDLEIEGNTLHEKYRKRFLEIYNNCDDNVFCNDKILDNLKEQIEEIEHQENKLREQHDYYYCGLDNLDDIDKRKYKELRKKI